MKAHGCYQLGKHRQQTWQTMAECQKVVNEVVRTTLGLVIKDLIQTKRQATQQKMLLETVMPGEKTLYKFVR